MFQLNHAYIAGFFDGEGHVGYHYKHSPNISFSQNDQRVLDAILESFPGGRIFRQTAPLRCHILQYNGSKAVPILMAIAPYLIVKYDEVQSYLELIDSRALRRV